MAQEDEFEIKGVTLFSDKNFDHLLTEDGGVQSHFFMLEPFEIPMDSSFLKICIWLYMVHIGM